MILKRRGPRTEPWGTPQELLPKDAFCSQSVMTEAPIYSKDKRLRASFDTETRLKPVKCEDSTHYAKTGQSIHINVPLKSHIDPLHQQILFYGFLLLYLKL